MKKRLFYKVAAVVFEVCVTVEAVKWLVWQIGTIFFDWYGMPAAVDIKGFLCVCVSCALWAIAARLDEHIEEAQKLDKERKQTAEAEFMRFKIRMLKNMWAFRVNNQLTEREARKFERIVDYTGREAIKEEKENEEEMECGTDTGNADSDCEHTR